MVIKPAAIDNPLLYCEACKKATRHTFIDTEKRTYQPVDKRYKYPKAYRKKVLKKETLYAHIYECLSCGKKRGFGNTVKDI